jgi:hypothetical protein
VHALCNAAIPGSHFCHVTEYLRANSSAVVPAGGAWIDPSVSPTSSNFNTGMPNSGRSPYGGTCESWTIGTSGSSAYWVTTAGTISVTGHCSSARSAACCF